MSYWCQTCNLCCVSITEYMTIVLTFKLSLFSLASEARMVYVGGILFPKHDIDLFDIQLKLRYRGLQHNIYIYTHACIHVHQHRWDVHWVKACRMKTHLSGMMKWSRDQSSLSEFCSGVPVMSRRWFVLKANRHL